MRRVVALLAIALCSPTAARGQPARSGNPILPGWYADPEAHVFDGQYWIFPTYSAPYDQQTFLDAFSSRDLITWVKHPRVLDIANVTWAKRAVWAPSIVEKDGWYYLFFGANDIQIDKQVGGIGVARARTPAGPFIDYLGKPLIGQFHNGAQPIDQMVFRDRDGSYYIVYGGWGHCNVAKLNADFTGVVPLPDGSTFKEITPKGYVEGAFMLIKGDKYYFMWSEGGWTGPDYAVAYAIGLSPFGPFERIGKILQQDSTVATGAGHHSVMQSPASGKWYIVYHRRPLGETDRNHRVVSIDEMHFDSRGYILPVKITKEGVPADPLPPGASAPHNASTSRPTLDSAAIDDIATLLELEDTRTFDSATLSRLVASPLPEVRRRAMLAVAHINDKRGVALLRAAPLDADTAIAATTVFAVGQLRDTLTIPWLDSLLSNPVTPPTVLTEAACALGKLKTAGAREVLARFLATVNSGARTDAAIGEALLSVGRSTARGDLAPALRWTTSRDEGIRWRATWALFRPRDPAAVKALLSLATDPSAEVRSWAVRGLAKPQADSASLAPQSLARLLAATHDPDRAVRTEAVRALASYPDSSAVAGLVDAVHSNDSWISVSAAEGLARPRAQGAVPALVAASRAGNGCALRVTAMRSLQGFAAADARAAAAELASDSIPYCRRAAEQLLRDTIPGVARAGAGGGRGGRRGPPRVVARPMDEYRAIVERWIVPGYEGRPLPRAQWQTTRGTIQLELYAADAPLAMDRFAKIMSTGTIIGTEFTRVVPDFVDQEATIQGAAVQRDEVNRHRLTRGNLAWASAGLDTGRPGYTLNHTPQPHNEGDFTSLGRVVVGQDVVDRIELGDRIVTAKLLGDR